jgi:hypothetical protein
MRARWLILVLLLGTVLAAGGWAGRRLWPRTLVFHPAAMIPVWNCSSGVQSVTLPGRFLVATIAQYDDEFFAYLMFTYLRTAPALRGSEVLLTYKETGGHLAYPIRIRLDNNLLSGIPLLAEARAQGLIGQECWRYLTGDALDRLRYQTQLFQTAYTLPVRRKLEHFTRAELVAYIRRFVRFKSLTDPRVRGAGGTPPQPLSSQQALQLAQDIVAVADFYSLPLDFFLGIGAMENNYMNVEGDLEHARWKRRPAPDDIVLKRGRHRVLVVDSALGVWQITRETLRYAQRLYLKDRRDYSLLPARLRPPKDLDFNNLDPEVLTTYAGLLFRDLLDRCHGDVTTAVGAYNGGIRNPNQHYAEGVELVAGYARRMMEHAAVLNGPVAEMRFIAAGQ